MIQNAFTSAYTNKVNAQNQGINTITSGIKDLGIAAMGLTAFSGGLGDGAISKASKYALASRVGGIGGAIMLSTMKEKKDSAIKKEETKQLFTAEQIGSTIEAQLGDNPINRSAKKTLSTVFETLVKAKEEKIINEKGKIESSIGKIDPNSELGKQILSNLSEKKNNKENDNLKKAVVYHGSNYDFDKFDPEEAKKRRGSLDLMGEGFYFTDDPEKAKGYGNKIYKTEIQYSTNYREAKEKGTEADYKYNKERGYWVIPYKYADRIKILDKESKE